LSAPSFGQPHLASKDNSVGRNSEAYCADPQLNRRIAAFDLIRPAPPHSNLLLRRSDKPGRFLNLAKWHMPKITRSRLIWLLCGAASIAAVSVAAAPMSARLFADDVQVCRKVSGNIAIAACSRAIASGRFQDRALARILSDRLESTTFRLRADHRMKDCFQSQTCALIRKDDRSHSLTVERAICIDDLRAEGRCEACDCAPAWSRQLAGNQVGGRFKLTALIQKRMLELMDGARPLVEREHNMTDLEVVIQEVLQDKIAIDYEGSGLDRPEATGADEPHARLRLRNVGHRQGTTRRVL